MSRGKTKTSSSQALEVENEPLATETIIDEMDDAIENKQGQRHMQYDAEYWKRATKTGCMIMVFMSVVSVFGEPNNIRVQ